MTTPLPEPKAFEVQRAMCEPYLLYTKVRGAISNDKLFTEDQMKAYGAAEYARAIEDAAVLCERLGQHAMAMAMRKLGATP